MYLNDAAKRNRLSPLIHFGTNCPRCATCPDHSFRVHLRTLEAASCGSVPAQSVRPFHSVAVVRERRQVKFSANEGKASYSFKEHPTTKITAIASYVIERVMHDTAY